MPAAVNVRSGRVGSTLIDPLITRVASDAESYAEADPIPEADMWDFIGAVYGGESNFVRTSVVDDGGVRGKIIRQSFTTRDGIALSGMPLPVVGNEASIEYYVRFSHVGVDDAWGWGGKLPGLGGKNPSVGGNPPDGNQPTPHGWSGRGMWITPEAGFPAENPLAPVEWCGYIYDPMQPPNVSGQNRRTRKIFAEDTWYHLKQYYKMNTIVTEGVTANTNGIHRMWLDGVQCFEKTNQVFRLYAAANVTHMMWDNFYGGNTADWYPTPGVTTTIDFDQLIIKVA